MPTKKEDRLAFTIAFGNERYLHMARTLEATIHKHSPGIDFRIFTDIDFTPLNEGLPEGREIHPKDYKFPKFEVMSHLTDEDTTYMFLDADTLVFEDLSPYFDMVTSEAVMIEYIFRGDKGWADVAELQFNSAAAEAGLHGLKPFSINSGFIVWKGRQACFSEALKLLKTTTIPDWKGKKGDEYYLCAALQLTNTNIIPIDYSKVKLGKLWNSEVGLYNNRLRCSACPKNDRMIMHYGNTNYDNPAIKKVSRRYYRTVYTVRGWYKFHRILVRRKVKNALGFLKKAAKSGLLAFGYRIVHVDSHAVLERNIFFDEFVIYRNRFNTNKPVIVDVGAHIGDSAAHYLKEFCDATIHCFEPVEDSFLHLQDRFKHVTTVIPNNIALGSECREQEIFVLGSKTTGNSFIQPMNEDVQKIQSKVRITTLDTYCQENGIDRIDLLKIDVQGFEREVLDGAVKMLESSSISFIKIECIFHDFYKTNTSFRSIEEVLDRYDYRLVDICEIKKSSRKRRTMMIDVIYSNVDM